MFKKGFLIFYYFFVLTAVVWAQSEDIKDIKPPVDYPTLSGLVWIMGAIVLIIIIGVLLWIKKREESSRASASIQQPWDIALDELNKLLAQKFIEGAQYNRFYFEISLILRKYIENRFKIKAAEMTTEEFLNFASCSTELNAPHKELLSGFLTFSDQVKFAKRTPNNEDIEKAVETIKNFVHETKLISKDSS